jgi:hypothetical protein
VTWCIKGWSRDETNLIVPLEWKFLSRATNPLKHTVKGGAAFPGITDLLYGVEQLSPASALTVYEEVKKHISGTVQPFFPKDLFKPMKVEAKWFNWWMIVKHKKRI